MGEPGDFYDPLGLYIEVDTFETSRGIHYHYYDRGWFGFSHEYLGSVFVPQNEGSETGRTAYDDVVDEYAKRPQEILNELNVASSRAVDALEITQATVGLAIAIAVPGPDDIALAALASAKAIRYFTKVGDEIIAIGNDGKRVDLTSEEVKIAKDSIEKHNKTDAAKDAAQVDKAAGAGKGCPEANAPSASSTVSTGRTAPRNLKEQIAMREVKANPSGRELPVRMSDKKNNLMAEDGWVKKAQNVDGVEIHYVENIRTGEITDFKFKD
jgi:hypothetical protein